MKNLKYFPFERNRYFYGKLLSVDDFEAEQRYMNDKRRMLNRFLYGTGVVCGLQVVEVDDFTISLEMGLALDFSGREIVVSAPVTKRLSAIEGFSQYDAAGEERQYLYVCIAYEEYPEEPVHNIAGVRDKQEEYNKYAEGYRLFITGEEPEQEGAHAAALYEETKTVFQGNGIRIQQRVPRYMQSGTEEDIIITVEKEWQEKPVAFSYQLNLSCMEQMGNAVATVSFDEREFSPAARYTFRVRVRAGVVENTKGRVEVVPDSFVLTVGEDTKKELVQAGFPVYITNTSIQEAVLRKYYDTAMEDIVKNTYEQPIYLARLYVIRAGDTYVIEGVENLPYQQYVWNNVIGSVMERMRMEKPSVAAPAPVVSADAGSRKIIQDNSKRQVRTGSTIINLGIGGVAGQCFYSEEIVHELGLGEVFISLGLAKGLQSGSQVVYGNPSVFGDSVLPQVELAAKVNMERGSFVIGARCLGKVESKQIRVRWLAVKNDSERLEETDVKYMTIRPDIVNLQTREGHYFEAAMGDEVLKHIKWSVKEAEGGTIDANGYYTAPNQAGVYEIVAENMENNQQRAVAYAIVRDVVDK